MTLSPWIHITRNGVQRSNNQVKISLITSSGLSGRAEEEAVEENEGGGLVGVDANDIRNL